VEFATGLQRFPEQGRQKRPLKPVQLQVFSPDAGAVQRVVEEALNQPGLKKLAQRGIAFKEGKECGGILEIERKGDGMTLDDPGRRFRAVGGTVFQGAKSGPFPGIAADELGTAFGGGCRRFLPVPGGSSSQPRWLRNNGGSVDIDELQLEGEHGEIAADGVTQPG